MTIHLHDLARTMHSERCSATIDAASRLPDTGDARGSLRSLVGSALIRAGTRLLPHTAEPSRVQSIPPC
jgi:hypothetical protein